MFAVVLLALGIASRVFISRFDRIELEQTEEKAAQGIRAVETDLNQLALSTRDYAEWDDAQQFILERDTAFIDANFSYDSLNGMHVDLVAILDADGSLIYSAELDEAHHSLFIPADSRLTNPLRSLLPRKDTLRKLDATRRLLDTESGILAFSGIEIRRSDRSAPTGAVMYFARFIKGDEIARARQTSQLPIEFYSYHQLPALPKSIASWASSPNPQSDTAAADIDADHASAYGLLRDLNNQAVALLRIPTDRGVATLGRRTTFGALGTIAALLLICGAALAYMLVALRKNIMARAAMEQRHRNILHSLDETILLADRTTGEVIEANQALLNAMDYEAADLQRLTVRQIYIDLGHDAFDRGGLIHSRLRCRDGRLIDMELTITNVADEGRQLICAVGRDLSMRQEAEARLKASEDRLARVLEFDDLTGFLSRAGLQRTLHDRVSAQPNASFCLMHIDVDQFKNINDVHGHVFGDQALVCIAKHLHEGCDEKALLARLGGDEFAVLIELNDDIAIRDHASRIQEALRREVTIAEQTLSVTASIGIAAFPQDSGDAQTLMKHADIALYQAKEAGRDTYRHYSSDMDVQLSEIMFLEQALRRAIGTSQIYVEYQPVIDLHTGLLVSFEALARWNHPDLGLISPVRFIPAAERSGLIVQLGEQILRAVVVQLRQWRDEGIPLAPVAVNVSPLQFERTSFSTVVHELLLEHDIEPSWLCFEITESAWLQNSQKHVVAIDTLRYEGSRIYIDDFGTGFSNLGYLKSLPVDALKIDQSFVRNMITDPNDRAIVGGVIHMASQLKISIIAEGVETAELAEALRAMGCHFAQGYYFSKPMPATHCKALLQQLDESRRFTETVKMRAFKAAESTAVIPTP
jgi:diguanylate cyclase (GGDEF)-like protein/PAS domain S-box-containing protein